MREYAEQNDIMSKPRKMLVTCYSSKKIMLITPLLKWYINKGLKVTKVHQFIQFKPSACFKSFGDQVSDARRLGDVDPSKKLIGETMKLIGNAYGKTVTNVAKHKDTQFQDKESAQKSINNKFFHSLNQVTDDCYEVLKRKKCITYQLPITIGFFVYQLSKLRMLEFVYDFLRRFVDPADYELCQTDTDSVYLACTAGSIEEVIKPDMMEIYKKEKNLWFPRDDTEEVAKYDKRTPGLFKVEHTGDSIISLCSKTYFVSGDKDKYSSKGLSKQQNDITKNDFLKVLETKSSGGGSNTGFRVRDNSMWTYTQQRDALSYFYPKRQVLSDGVQTVPLDY